MREQLAQDILTARMRANLERRNDNPLAGQAWDAEADALEHQLLLMERASEWDVLKGSPDTSRLGNG